MKLSSHKIERESRLELSMTSMIDVVFLLLIFFMVSSSFVKTERDLDSGIKVERQSASQQQSDFEPAIVDVVESDGSFRLSARQPGVRDATGACCRSCANSRTRRMVPSSVSATTPPLTWPPLPFRPARPQNSRRCLMSLWIESADQSARSACAAAGLTANCGGDGLRPMAVGHAVPAA